MIKLIDYGVGNIQAFLTLFKRNGILAERASKLEDLNDTSHLILPGVGHFDHAMQCFNNSGLRNRLEHLVLEKKVPFVGICVGMQMLSNGSEEGSLPGLGWIPGNVRSFANTPVKAKLPMPHMGWNTVFPKEDSVLFKYGFESEPQFYFLHSYYFDAKNKDDVSATAHYGIDFDSVVSKGNIHGIQFHPEKSHHWGSQLLKNFAEL